MNHVEPLIQVIRQEQNEQLYNRKHIDAKIRAFIESHPDMVSKTDHGVALVQAYMDKSYYESKDKRMAQLKLMNTRELVIDVFIGIGYCLHPQLFTAVSAILSSRLQFSDRREGILTSAELLAVLCLTDAFDIQKAGKSASMEVVSCIPLPESIIDFIEHSEYLPPMVCEPLKLTHNFSSGYLTHNDSLILGSGNHHDGDICLDVLNTMNSVALTLDIQFLSTVEEEPTFELDDADKIKQWNAFKKQSYRFYKLMVDCGNRIYFTHKVDKRGRIYCSGYHITTQGTPFKKAMLELADAELVTGVPN
jgi:hypothetical protein